MFLVSIMELEDTQPLELHQFLLSMKMLLLT
jgi:hypothetical protein